MQTSLAVVCPMKPPASPATNPSTFKPSPAIWEWDASLFSRTVGIYSEENFGTGSVGIAEEEDEASIICRAMGCLSCRMVSSRSVSENQIGKLNLLKYVVHGYCRH